jgi:hypothetical protein
MLAVPHVLGNRDLNPLFSSALLQASEKDYLLPSIILTNAKNRGRAPVVKIISRDTRLQSKRLV